MRREDRFPSSYTKSLWLKPANQKEPINLVISSIEQVELQGEMETVISFKNDERKFICNVTCWKLCAAVLGDDDKDWIGKAICIHPDECDYQGAEVACLRCRAVPDNIDESEIPF